MYLPNDSIYMKFQKQAKVSDGDGCQNSDDLWGWCRGGVIDQDVGNVLSLDLDGGHVGLYIRTIKIYGLYSVCYNSTKNKKQITN